MDPAKDVPAATSDRFRALHAAMGEVVRSVFPDAEASAAYGMAGWTVAVPDPPPESEWRGTLPRTHLAVYPSERRAGVTLHVWHPNAPGLLADEAPWLREAGFKVMVGCVQWNRKADLPVDALERLLRRARERF